MKGFFLQEHFSCSKQLKPQAKLFIPSPRYRRLCPRKSFSKLQSILRDNYRMSDVGHIPQSKVRWEKKGETWGHVVGGRPHRGRDEAPEVGGVAVTALFCLIFLPTLLPLCSSSKLQHSQYFCLPQSENLGKYLNISSSH